MFAVPLSGVLIVKGKFYFGVCRMFLREPAAGVEHGVRDIPGGFPVSAVPHLVSHSLGCFCPLDCVS